MPNHFRVLLLTCLLMAGGCQRDLPGSDQGEFMAGAAPAPLRPKSADASAANVAPDQDAMLAYEHAAQLRIAARDIPDRLAQVQAACTTRRFGVCQVLSVQQSGGVEGRDGEQSASLGIRIVPAGVEPMIALAGGGGELASRSTQAEDLAQVVRDNDALRARLQRERDRLLEFQQRRDLAVADMIALSKQLAEIEIQLEAVQRDAAQHQRRLQTHLLNLHWSPSGGEAGRSEVGQAMRDVGRTLALGTAWTIRALAFLVPLLALLLLLRLLWRRLRARRRGA